MDNGFRERLDQAMRETTCEEGFTCIVNEFKDVCRAQDLGLEHYVECLDERGGTCPNSLSFGNGLLCHCRVRVLASRELGV